MSSFHDITSGFLNKAVTPKNAAPCFTSRSRSNTVSESGCTVNSLRSKRSPFEQLLIVLPERLERRLLKLVFRSQLIDPHNDRKGLPRIVLVERLGSREGQSPLLRVAAAPDGQYRRQKDHEHIGRGLAATCAAAFSESRDNPLQNGEPISVQRLSPPLPSTADTF